jgi:soluble lytic murein transglycosylase-like protein
MSGVAYAKLSAAQVANARLIASIARQMGVDPVLAIATAWQESGLKNSATGDGGTSFGLYQLHEGGELGSHSAQWARNPRNNIRQALSVFAQVQHQTGLRGGAEAAAAQRPADRSGYASAVNAGLGNARQLLQGGLGGAASTRGSVPKAGKGSMAALLALMGQQQPQAGGALAAFQSPASILQNQFSPAAVGSVQAQQVNPTAGPSGQSPMQLSNSLDSIRRKLLV